MRHAPGYQDFSGHERKQRSLHYYFTPSTTNALTGNRIPSLPNAFTSSSFNLFINLSLSDSPKPWCVSHAPLKPFIKVPVRATRTGGKVPDYFIYFTPSTTNALTANLIPSFPNAFTNSSFNLVFRFSLCNSVFVARNLLTIAPFIKPANVSSGCW